MTSIEITPEERSELHRALTDALTPLATAVRSRQSGLSEARMWEADPVEVTLSVLAAWKVVDTEVKNLAAIAAATAGSYGANYEQMGAAWGVTRQGARKKWPDAVPRPAVTASQRGGSLELFGGTAALVQNPSGWTWTGRGADGTRGATEDGTWYGAKEEAAALAGAFLREHATALP